MPQQDKSHATIGRSELEGRTFEPTTRAELEEAIRLAFDYRGDVTLRLKDGTTAEGFIFNHNAQAGSISLFVKEGKDSVAKDVRFDDVQSVIFSGADVAFGTSWEDWQAKSAKQRAAEAARLAEKSAQLGHL
ncbi:MAG: hypothetical protein SFU85_10180 [Candidatus Methylacidiphilales bacterium]|nr:hypothetical protein [Candidatus Methylacidiphilales bacterium]